MTEMYATGSLMNRGIMVGYGIFNDYYISLNIKY